MNEGDSARKRDLPWVIAGLAFLLFLGLLWLPQLLAKNDRGRTLYSIEKNLRILEGAKEQWALGHHATKDALPTRADLAPYLKGGKFIKPAAGEIYTITPVGELITAKLTRRVSWHKAGTLLTVTNVWPQSRIP